MGMVYAEAEKTPTRILKQEQQEPGFVSAPEFSILARESGKAMQKEMPHLSARAVPVCCPEPEAVQEFPIVPGIFTFAMQMGWQVQKELDHGSAMVPPLLMVLLPHREISSNVLRKHLRQGLGIRIIPLLGQVVPCPMAFITARISSYPVRQMPKVLLLEKLFSAEDADF